jgi:hypothetical protein
MYGSQAGNMNRNAGTNRSGAGNLNANRSNAGGMNNRQGAGNATAGRNATGLNANRAGGANVGNANRGAGGANANRMSAGNARAGRNAGGANANRAGGANANNARGGPNNRAGNTRVAARKPDRVVHVGNKTVAYRPDGKVRTIQTRGMVIHNGVHGRTIVTERNGHRIVSMGRGRGYMERPYLRRNGRAYVQRSYYWHGRRYAYAYRSYYWRGRPYYGYAPAYYYRPAYYGWAYRPWPAPAYYRWGYYRDPWYGYYNYYYQPYPSYPSASPWLSDYIFSEQLRQAYEARLNSGVFPRWTELYASLAGPQGGEGGTAIPREVKQAISDEVKQEIEGEQQAAGGSQQSGGGGDETPKALDPNFTTFIVSSDLDITDDGGNECSLSAGDVITRTSDQAGDDNKVGVQVAASKKDDCAVGTNGQVDVSDLQEMYNHFREMLDGGLKSLAENAGKGGLPTAPDTTTTAGEVPAPTADANVESDLQAEEQEAEQAEQQVTSGQGNNQ